MKKSLISSHSAYHRPRDKLVTYYLTAYDLDVQRQNMARDKPLVGRVSYANGDRATKPAACKAVTDRRYRRNWSVRFIDALYELQLPSRDCHVASLLAMTNLWLSPFYRQPVPISSIAPGPAVRSPTYYTYAKNQGQAIGLPLCFVLLQLRVAHEDGRELCAGGIAGRLEAAVLAVDDARTDAPAQRVNSP